MRYLAHNKDCRGLFESIGKEAKRAKIVEVAAMELQPPEIMDSVLSKLEAGVVGGVDLRGLKKVLYGGGRKEGR